MKFLIFIYLFLGSTSLMAYPLFSDKMSPCALNYYDFCQSVDPSIKNMCPDKVTESSKKNCLISELNKQVIEKECRVDLEGVCRNLKSFKEKYLCLVHPKKSTSLADLERDRSVEDIESLSERESDDTFRRHPYSQI